jgi:hypothetical protein
MKIPAFVSLGLLLISTGCGPIGPMPGLAIGGDKQPVPNDFAFVQDHDLIQIRTHLGGWLPQVHHIWGVGIGDKIYATAVPDASWRKRVSEDPEVLLRVGEAHYELVASTVDNPAETQRAYTAYQAKYGPQLEEFLGRPGTIEDMNDLIRFSSR